MQYGAPVETMVFLGGGKLLKLDMPMKVGRNILKMRYDKTAAILYVKSHHAVQKNMISVEEAWEVAQRRGVPLNCGCCSGRGYP